MNDAVKATGFSDFGDPSFREPLELLLESLRNEAMLTPFGRESAIDLLTSKLQARLRVVGAHARHPQIRAGRIESPIFIVGLPRTGSTLVHHLFGVDDRVRVPRRWELLRPWPAPETATYLTDFRIEAANRELMPSYERRPHLRAMRPTRGDFPEECTHILTAHFLGGLFSTLFDVPTFQHAIMRGDLRAAYRFHKMFLQLLQWRCPATPWVLKYPMHLGHLDDLVRIYPDARIIWLHRDPVEVITSATHLVSIAHRAHCECERSATTALRLTEEWSYRTRTAMEQRARIEDSHGPWHDVWYDELIADPLSCMAEIYAWAGLVLPYGTLFRMRDYVVRPPYPRGGYTHDRERLGVNAERVEHEFADYIATYLG